MKNIPVRYIHPLPSDEHFSGSFNIRKVSDMLTGKDLQQELHRHSFFYILVLEKGAGRHSVDFTTYSISPRCVFLLRPGQVHEIELKKGSSGYLMIFTADFYYPHNKAARQLLQQATRTTLCRPGAGRFKKLLPILAGIFDEYRVRQPEYLEVIKALLGIFFIELIRQQQHPGNPANATGAYAQMRLQEFMELLEKHAAEQKQPAYYAGRLSLSLYQLNAITKATLGKTSSAVISDYLVLEAKRHLLATSNQVKEIAYQLGYEDVSYFIRFFRKHTGYTPEAFRNN